MNSKQRRRLRRQQMPKLIVLLATQRLTGELKPWMSVPDLLKAAERNPQHIAAAMRYIGAGLVIHHLNFVPLRRPHSVRGKSPNYAICDDQLDAISYGFSQTFRPPKEVSPPRQENAGSL